MFVGGPSTIKQVADRHAGISSAVAAAGDGFELMTSSAPTLTVAEGRAVGEHVAALPPAERPTAAFCANDMMALGFLQAMAASGLRVPDDLAIIGYDDIDFAAAAAVPLSSVRQPRELLGRTAIDLLIEEVTEPEQHRHRQVIFQPDLVIRESSALRRNA
jgi:LacI family transcriptional regulator